MDEKTNQRPSEICSEGAGPEGGEGPEKTGRPAFPLALCEVCTALENRVEERTHRLSEEVEERKRVETALRENEMRFMDFAAAAADRFWETDENHRYIYMSPPPDHHFLDEEKLIGRTRWEIEGMEVDEVTWAEHRADLEARRPFRGFRFAQFRADGGKRHLRLNGKPVFDEEGHFKGYRGTAVDETAEVEARDKEQVIWTRFIDAMEKMSEGVLLWDRENHFVMCNDYFKKLDPEVAKFLVPGI
ncbi:MAG: PAS domain-containing protein, partial [Nitrospinota bacterium]|nr:PAS domain-containing protein [Nitrospinota bacterium]